MHTHTHTRVHTQFEKVRLNRNLETEMERALKRPAWKELRQWEEKGT